MAENSKIEWTDHTFNPWMGCTKVSPACQNCYAERDMDHRYGKVAWGPKGTRVLTSEANWRKPLRWEREARETGKPLRVFCASLADVFEDWGGNLLNSKGVPVFNMGWVRKRLFKLIESTPNLIWLLLTKRPENIRQFWPSPKLFQNVWLGTSIENQEWTDKRLPYLHEAKRAGIVLTTFVSAEPLVGPVVLQGNFGGTYYNHLGQSGIDWVITGGESGPNARPCDPDWFRSLRDQCELTETPFHFKQWGEFDENGERVGKKAAGRLLDNVEHNGIPELVYEV